MIAKYNMPAGFATEVVAALEHGVDDVLVTDIGTDECAARFGDGGLKAAICHYGADQGVVAKSTIFQQIQRADGEDIIAIDKLTVLIAKQDTVSVAVMGNANLSRVF